ncbi:MAG: alginate lyase family protein [Candidatus Sulfotelmatobacter sp.]
MGKLATMLQVGRAFGVRDGMLRLEYELERGSGLMARRMRSVQGWNAWDLKRIAPYVSPETLLQVRRENDRRENGPRDGASKFFFSDVRSLAEPIKQIIGPDGENSILAETERILIGKLPFFGNLSLDCGFPPRWFENAATGQSVSPREHWTQMRFASPIYGDLKFILEPSRFLFVYPLVRAYALSGDERFAQAFWSLLEDWAAHSPPLSGPLWICGQECSLRILAWSFGLHGFIHSPFTTPQRVALLFSLIASHAWRTAQTISYARSQRSNHLISEAVGLWTAGTLYPELHGAPGWQDSGAEILHEAVLDQIPPEGVSHQHSFNYQRMILQLLLWTVRLAEIHGAVLHEDIRSRARTAFDFIRCWVDPINGSVPNHGSNDGSLILPLAAANYADYRPLLQLGAAVLNRPALKSGTWDEPAMWFGLKPVASRSAASFPCPAPETGYFRLGDADSWALIRAGQYTRRPFQADQLHVDLWWQGINIARDPGTYLYNGPAPWNNAFAGSSVHNTVTVDGRDQMTRAGRFLWLDWAQASGRVFARENSAHANCFEGEHNGYRDLGVTHRRTVLRLPLGWLVMDDVTGAGGRDLREHDLHLRWLTPDSPYKVQQSPFQVVFTQAQSHICWSFFASAPAQAALVRAGTVIEKTSNFNLASRDSTLLGWEAPTYGDLQPAVSLLYHARSRLPFRFVTLIVTSATSDSAT